MLDPEKYIQAIQEYGNTDTSYLNWHINRFCMTCELVNQIYPSTEVRKNIRVLDVASHWMHQAYVFSKAGYDVASIDLAGGIRNVGSVKELVKDNNIDLYDYSDMESDTAFDCVPAQSVDLILFAETIEHITFNPVDMWRSMIRTLKPGGRIIITTPNYYFWGSRAWDLKRFLSLRGGGISIDEIMNTVTYGHHWKEFSGKELIDYFKRIDPDLYLERGEYISFNKPNREKQSTTRTAVFHWLEKHIRIFRDSIYLQYRLDCLEPPDKGSATPRL